MTIARQFQGAKMSLRTRVTRFHMTRVCLRALIVSAAFSLILVSPSIASNSRQSAVDGATAPAEGIPYFVADGTGRTGYRAGDRELATWALAAWQRSAGPTLRFEPAPENKALLRVYWADPADGQYR